MLLNPELSTAERLELGDQKKKHFEDAVSQRSAIKKYLEEFYRIVTNVDRDIDLPLWIYSEMKEKPDITLSESSLLVEAEDFGGSIALPHYGYQRPSSDYFNSNLMLQNFVVADNADKIYFYDERGQGKGADCLCSLRIYHHIEVKSCVDAPRILVIDTNEILSET